MKFFAIVVAAQLATALPIAQDCAAGDAACQTISSVPGLTEATGSLSGGVPLRSTKRDELMDTLDGQPLGSPGSSLRDDQPNLIGRASEHNVQEGEHKHEEADYETEEHEHEHEHEQEHEHENEYEHEVDEDEADYAELYEGDKEVEEVEVVEESSGPLDILGSLGARDNVTPSNKAPTGPTEDEDNEPEVVEESSGPLDILGSIGARDTVTPSSEDVSESIPEIYQEANMALPELTQRDGPFSDLTGDMSKTFSDTHNHYEESAPEVTSAAYESAPTTSAAYAQVPEPSKAYGAVPTPSHVDSVITTPSAAYGMVHKPSNVYESVPTPSKDAYESVPTPSKDAYESVPTPSKDAYESVPTPSKDAYESVPTPSKDAYESIPTPVHDSYETLTIEDSYETLPMENTYDETLPAEDTNEEISGGLADILDLASLLPVV